MEITGELKQNEEIKNMLNDISKENELLGNELIKAFPNELELKENEYFYKNKKGEWCIWKNPDTNAKVVAIWKPEKTADELFEEENYTKEFYDRNGNETNKNNVQVLVYKLEPEKYEIETQIEFYLEDKEIGINGLINQKILQAINKKVEELGWK